MQYIANFDMELKRLRSIILEDEIRGYMEALRAPLIDMRGQFDEANAEAYKAFVKQLGGPVKFAESLIGPAATRKVRSHLQELSYDPDVNVPGFKDFIYGQEVTKVEAGGRSASYDQWLFTQRLRKEYKQTLTMPERTVTENVNGVLKTTVLAAEPERVVEAYESDPEDRESRRIIPYYRGADGNTITQAALKRKLGIPTIKELLAQEQNEKSKAYLQASAEYDNRNIMEMFLISKDGQQVVLAQSTILRMRETHRQLYLAYQQAKEAYVEAKASGDRDCKNQAWASYQEAYLKADKQLRLCKEVESLVNRFKRQELDEEPVLHRVDIGHLTMIQGPWPLFVSKPVLGGMRLAIRCLKADLTKEGYELRRQQYEDWKESPEGQAKLAAARKAWLKTPDGQRWLQAKRQEADDLREKQTRPHYGDIPLI
jgi:hypothetical protein